MCALDFESRAPRALRPAAAPRSRRLVFALALGWLAGSWLGCSLFDRSDILLLVRAEDPISQAIALEYAETRGISKQRILALPIAPDAGAEIELDDYRRTIAEPIEAYLAKADPHGEITTLVTTRGLPLRIGHCRSEPGRFPRACSAAAIDAALAGLGRINLSSEPPGEKSGLGRAPNPYFGDDRSFEQFRRDQPQASLRFLVARLTGPASPVDPASGVPLAMRGLLGPGPEASDASAFGFAWQILDGQPIEQRSVAMRALLDPIRMRLGHLAVHRVCDGCDRASRDPRPAGIVLTHQVSPKAALDAAQLRLGAPGLAIDLVGATLGTGEPEAADLARFESRLAEWLAVGATLISSHLADPSLAGVARPDLQLEALTRGKTMAEAHFRSLPHLGWINVLIGDPLAVLPLARATHEAQAAAEAVRSAGAQADSDRDGVVDAEDNCLLEPNPAQRDSDADQIGNRCDPDVNNDGRVDTSWGRIYPRGARGDLEAIALTARNGPHDPNHDLDGDGRVDARDLALAQLWLFRAPGPSGRLESSTPSYGMAPDD
jgi:hypothetical protein